MTITLKHVRSIAVFNAIFNLFSLNVFDFSDSSCTTPPICNYCYENVAWQKHSIVFVFLTISLWCVWKVRVTFVCYTHAPQCECRLSHIVVGEVGNIFIFPLSPFLSCSKWEKALNKLNSPLFVFGGWGRGGGGQWKTVPAMDKLYVPTFPWSCLIAFSAHLLSVYWTKAQP